MVKINLKNVETLLFNNAEVRATLPEFRHIFDQWHLSYRVPALNNIRKKTLLDLLNSLNGPQIEKLARLFNDTIEVETLDYNITKSFKFPISGPIERELSKHTLYKNISISRNAKQLYITIWR